MLHLFLLFGMVVRRLEEKVRIPYKQEFDHRFIKHIRHVRNKTQADFAQVMKIDKSTLGKLERSELKFTRYYDTKLKEAVNRLRVSGVELSSIRKMVEMMEQRGYK